MIVFVTQNELDLMRYALVKKGRANQGGLSTSSQLSESGQLAWCLLYNKGAMERRVLKENQVEEGHCLEQSFTKKQASPCLPDELALKVESSDPDPLALTPRDLSLDNNNHSLGLLGRSSIEKGLPIPRAMLSHDDQGEELPEEDEEEEALSVGGESESEELYFEHRVKMEEAEAAQPSFVDQLGLNELIGMKRPPKNTKNVLRNFGNAQNQYVLYHKEAKAHLRESLVALERFVKWIRSIRLEKFDDFKQCWANQDNPVFGRVYRELCYRFYIDHAVPYVLSSRMRDAETKHSHLRYIYRFLEGLQRPEDFSYFHKTEK